METQLSQFQYTTPRITKFNYSANTNPVTKANIQINIQHNKSIRKISENEALVELDVCISAAEGESPFTIDFSINAKFRWGQMNKENVLQIINQNAPSLLISFARPLIINFTCSSGIAPFYLPYLDFTNEPIIDIFESGDTDVQITS